MTQHMKKSTAVWVKTAAGTDSRRWSWLSATVHCTGSEMVKHVGPRSSLFRMCCTAKEMGIKCLWTWGRHYTLGRYGGFRESLGSAHSGRVVVSWNGHKNIRGCQTSGSRGEREMSTEQLGPSVKVPAGATYLNYSSNPLADLPRCRAIWGMSHKLGGNVRCTPVRWRVVTSTTLCWDLLFPSPLASAVIKAAMKSVEKCEGRMVSVRL